MDREAMDILEMVKSGQVSPEQGAQLLEALKNPGAGLAPVAGQKAKFIRARVNVSKPGGQENVVVNVNLPIALADLALKLAEGAKIQQGDQTIIVGEYIKNLSGMDVGTIMQLVKEGASGKLVDVEVQGGAEKENVKVEVTVD